MYDAFVCYSMEDPRDRQFVRNLIEEIELLRGLKLFVPGRDDLPGAAENNITAYLIEKRYVSKVSKGAKIRNRYNQVPHLTQNTKGKVTNSQFDTTNESQEISPFPAGDHEAHINRRAKRHSKHKTEKNPQKIHKRSTALERSVKIITGGLKPVSDVDQET